MLFVLESGGGLKDSWGFCTLGSFTLREQQGPSQFAAPPPAGGGPRRAVACARWRSDRPRRDGTGQGRLGGVVLARTLVHFVRLGFYFGRQPIGCPVP